MIFSLFLLLPTTLEILHPSPFILLPTHILLPFLLGSHPRPSPILPPSYSPPPPDTHMWMAMGCDGMQQNT